LFPIFSAIPGVLSVAVPGRTFPRAGQPQAIRENRRFKERFAAAGVLRLPGLARPVCDTPDDALLPQDSHEA